MNRYELEHEKLVRDFFADGKGMIREVEKQGRHYFSVLYQKTEEAKASPGKYGEENFDAGLLEYADDVQIVRAILPDPEKPSDSSLIYLITDPDGEPLRYLTVELSPDGRYVLLSWDGEGRYTDLGDYDPGEESEIIGKVIAGIFQGTEELEELTKILNEMRDLLHKFNMDFYEEEVPDFVQMFQVIHTLTKGRLTLEEEVGTFAEMKNIVRDEEQYVTGHDKIKGQYDHFEAFPLSAGKLDHKGKLFFAFCVYAACNVLSEKDEKKHHYVGLAEFDDAENIKCLMEEYWGLDPYMFKVK